MTNLKEAQTEKIYDFLKNLSTEVSILDYIKIEDIDFENAFDYIFDKIYEDGGFDIEVIYYNTAIDYLMRNDPSLRNSLELAYEFGFKVNQLTSEILASLLKSDEVKEEFLELEDEITDFFKEINNELE